MNQDTVNIVIYRWAGKWGPFEVKIPCGECALTTDIVEDTTKKELNGIPVHIEVREWLSEWWKPLMASGWHAPIVMVDGKVISQGVALNRGVLTEAVIDAYAKKTTLTGNHVFGKENCPYCTKAKELLDKEGTAYTYHDVVDSPRALYEMLARAKQAKDFSKTPITTPQIWLEGDYIGGTDELRRKLKEEVY